MNYRSSMTSRNHRSKLTCESLEDRRLMASMMDIVTHMPAAVQTPSTKVSTAFVDQLGPTQVLGSIKSQLTTANSQPTTQLAGTFVDEPGGPQVLGPVKSPIKNVNFQPAAHLSGTDDFFAYYCGVNNLIGPHNPQIS